MLDRLYADAQNKKQEQSHQMEVDEEVEAEVEAEAAAEEDEDEDEEEDSDPGGCKCVNSRSQARGGSIANINADGTFTHAEEVNDDDGGDF